MLGFFTLFYFYVGHYWRFIEKFLSGVEKAKYGQKQRAKGLIPSALKLERRCYRGFIKPRGRPLFLSNLFLRWDGEVSVPALGGVV